MSKTATHNRCKACMHPQVEQINADAAANVSNRVIGEKYDLSRESVRRHVNNHLALGLQTIVAEKRVEDAIDVHEEFKQQLAFARKMRVVAQEWLSDPVDPLQLTVIPRANEIDVVYFDHNETDANGNPKRKVAKLDMLLASLWDEAGFRADQFKITVPDLRRWALDTVKVTDICIDKFARLAGLYVKDKPNPIDAESTAKELYDLAVKAGHTPEAARAFIAERYAVSMPETLTTDVVQ